MRKNVVIYEEAVSHIWHCTRSFLNFLLFEESSVGWRLIAYAQLRTTGYNSFHTKREREKSDIEFIKRFNFIYKIKDSHLRSQPGWMNVLFTPNVWDVLPPLPPPPFRTSVTPRWTRRSEASTRWHPMGQFGLGGQSPFIFPRFVW